MKPRDFLNQFKTKTGGLILFGAVLAAALTVFSVVRKRHIPADEAIPVTPLATNSLAGKPQVVQTIVRPFQVFHPPQPKLPPASTAFPSTSASPPPVAAVFTNTSPQTLSQPLSAPMSQPVPVAQAVTPRQTEPLASISLFADATVGGPRPKKLSAVYAPFGRLIPCETIVTVDSSSLQTPIIGLVTENIYFGGRLIISAGTEVHGMAQTDRQRERIAGNTSWTLVWQDGEEMHLNAIALDREFENSTNLTGWAITDGSAGLRGELIKSDEMADIKLFAATFLSGAANSLTEKQETVFGPVNSPSLNNAPFAGAQAVLQTYAQQIYDSIQKNGFYVRVPSGKQFYLYVLQTIDRADATFGGTGITADEPPATPTKSKP